MKLLLLMLMMIMMMMKMTIMMIRMVDIIVWQYQSSSSKLGLPARRLSSEPSSPISYYHYVDYDGDEDFFPF